jgi:hypothetical protein
MDGDDDDDDDDGDNNNLVYRPDIIIKNKTDKIFLLIWVATPSDRDVIQKEAENKLKYKNLSIKIEGMWNMKQIIGASEIVTKVKKKR